jgi:hypothetical protein
MRLVPAALLVLLTLAACAAPTPYAPADPGDVDDRGYTSAPIAPDRFRVAFSGNSFTPRETVEDYLLFRAAEVALAEDCPFFRVDRRETVAGDRGDVGGEGSGPRVRPSFGIGIVGDAGGATVSAGKVGFGFGFGVPLYRAEPVRRGLTAYAEITCLRERPAEPGPALYDARAVIEAIGPRVVPGET